VGLPSATELTVDSCNVPPHPKHLKADAKMGCERFLAGAWEQRNEGITRHKKYGGQALGLRFLFPVELLHEERTAGAEECLGWLMFKE
jgi:hypothetical protein